MDQIYYQFWLYIIIGRLVTPQFCKSRFFLSRYCESWCEWSVSISESSGNNICRSSGVVRGRWQMNASFIEIQLYSVDYIRRWANSVCFYIRESVLQYCCCCSECKYWRWKWSSRLFWCRFFQVPKFLICVLCFVVKSVMFVSKFICKLNEKTRVRSKFCNWAKSGVIEIVFIEI